MNTGRKAYGKPDKTTVWVGAQEARHLVDSPHLLRVHAGVEYHQAPGVKEEATKTPDTLQLQVLIGLVDASLVQKNFMTHDTMKQDIRAEEQQHMKHEETEHATERTLGLFDVAVVSGSERQDAPARGQSKDGSREQTTETSDGQVVGQTMPPTFFSDSRSNCGR